MPTKKKVEPVQEDSVQEQAEEARVEPVVCGHINRHHYGPDGKLLDLVCDLEPKHTGDHHAKYMRKVGEPVADEKGRVVKTTYHEEEHDAYWGDAAGRPADQIQEGEVAQMSLLQKDLVMQILNKNPKLTVQQAVAQAKALKEWTLADEPS